VCQIFGAILYMPWYIVDAGYLNFLVACCHSGQTCVAFES